MLFWQITEKREVIHVVPEQLTCVVPEQIRGMIHVVPEPLICDVPEQIRGTIPCCSGKLCDVY